MHPEIQRALSAARDDDLRRAADRWIRLQTAPLPRRPHAATRAWRRYFGHAGQAQSSHFVGRTGELAELELALSEAANGQPVLVLVGGDSGVGKSRLVGEFERRVASESVLVLRGEGIDHGEAELPYAPLLGALRPLVRHRHPALDALSPGSRTQLAALLPALGDGGPSPDQHDPVGQSPGFFEALLELLDLLSESGPLVLVLEDMHWADRSTRTFAQFPPAACARSG